jgi:hypothetical protein
MCLVAFQRETHLQDLVRRSTELLLRSSSRQWRSVPLHFFSPVSTRLSSLLTQSVIEASKLTAEHRRLPMCVDVDITLHGGEVDSIAVEHGNSLASKCWLINTEDSEWAFTMCLLEN